MAPWLERALEFISGGPDASTAETLFRGALFGCSLCALVQLLTMVGTRWGNRNALAKALFLSVLVHVCVMLAGAARQEAYRPAAAAPAVENRIMLRSAQVASEGEIAQARSGELAANEQSLDLPQEEFTRGRSAAPAGDPKLPVAQRNRPARPLSDTAQPQTLPAPTAADEAADVRRRSQREKRPDPSVAEAAVPAIPADESARAPRRDADTADRAPQRVARAPKTTRPVEIDRQRQSLESLPAAPADVSIDATTADEPGTTSPQPARPAERAARRSNDTAGTADSGARPARRPVEIPRQVSSRAVMGVLRGAVVDAETGEPLPHATIRFDQADGGPLTTITSEQGTYELPVSDAPENFAITATHDGYLAQSQNMRKADVCRQSPQLNFSLLRATESVIAIENDPEVHHLGNDRFEGAINSQFQRKAEGKSLTRRFPASAAQVRLKRAQASVSLMVRGVQCTPKVQINGTTLPTRPEKSPADGSFGPLVVPFDPALLREGENELRIDAVQCNGDLDDFEFVNLQIRLVRGE